MIDILNVPPESGQDGLEMEIANKPIQVVNVFFVYSKDEPALQNILFEALSGQLIAFAGPSGGGKTTLFALLE